MSAVPLSRLCQPRSPQLAAAAAGPAAASCRRQHNIALAPLPSHAQVVIAGSGMIGNSIAYHLVERGWRDIVIIDKGNIADGTSKYGSGIELSTKLREISQHSERVKALH